MTVAGVDIGQRRDFTAVVTLDGQGVVRGAHQLRLGQGWSEIVTGVAALCGDCELIAIDATGMGGPIAEALATRLPGAKVEPFLFTRSSKRQLIGLLSQVIGEGQIRVDAAAPGAEALREELRRFVATPTRTGWAFTGKAGGGHDDLVIALGLAVHGALLQRRLGISLASEPVGVSAIAKSYQGK